MVERGRWGVKRKEYEDRLCDVCHCIEDEFHVFVECCRFDSVRKSFLPVCMKKNASMAQFVEVLSISSHVNVSKIALCCSKFLDAYRKCMHDVS